MVLTLLFAFQNCGSSEGQISSGGDAGAAEINDKVSRLDQLIQLDLHCAADTDCDVIPIGVRGCGGPAGYSVASKLNPSLNEIFLLADEIAELSRIYNERSELISTCEYFMPPVAKCLQAICKATEPAPQP